jgi:hypothetical protein
MSVVSYREILPRTFQHRLGEPPRATTKWNVTVSAPVGHQTIINTIGILHGSEHPEYSYLVCTDANITETDRHHVEATYTYEVPPPGQGPEGNFQPNPLARPDVWSFSTGGAQVPALVYFNGTGNADKRPLVNAANEYIEGLTVAEAEVRLTISGNRPAFPSALAAAVTNAVNSSQFLFGTAHQWQCAGITGSQASEVVNGLVVNYWQVGAELVFRASGHNLLLPHVGRNYLASGELYPVTVMGPAGLPIEASTPQPLNSDGTQKDAGQAPDILVRRVYPEVNFTAYFGTPPF